jgi:CheY-like chemotaxis protein
MPRILVIDDQPDVRATIARALTVEGFEVDTAENGKSGVGTFQGAHFDLAIVDIYMPDMDGVTVIKTLRLLRPGLPVIAISGHLLHNERSALEFVRAAQGALSDVVCLQKPFRVGELIEAVQQSLATSGLS